MTREQSVALLNSELAACIGRTSDDLTKIPLETARANANASLRSLGGIVERPPQLLAISGLKDEPFVELRVHRPPTPMPKLAILHIHGGGMVKGSAAAMDGRVSSLAKSIDAVIVSVGYRLAPETRFPGQLKDCVAAWLWMSDQAESWGLTPANCIIAGDSAGGGLAAATSLYLRDMRAPLPAGQVLAYPMLDYTTGAGAQEFEDERLGWNSRNNQFGWRALLGNQDVPTGQTLGYYSPSHAASFEGLPPTWIGVGTIDLFLDENLAFAAQMARANCDVQVMTYRGAPHGFPSFPSSVSARFIKDYHAAFRQYF
jgi:acetyl esterase